MSRLAVTLMCAGINIGLLVIIFTTEWIDRRKGYEGHVCPKEET